MSEEDQRYNRNWIIGIISGLLILALLAGAWMVMVKDQLLGQGLERREDSHLMMKLPPQLVQHHQIL